MVRVTGSLLILCAFAVGACSATTPRIDKFDASVSMDAGPDEDAEMPIQRTLCSIDVADCDFSSANGCPMEPPVTGTSCSLSVNDSCYYCRGPRSEWTRQAGRDVWRCRDGMWRQQRLVCN